MRDALCANALPSLRHDAPLTLLCAETVKLWAHHLPEAVKAPGANFTPPSLPSFSGMESSESHSELYEEEVHTWLSGHSVQASA
eukprot:NODE_5885_length_547_cov_215.451220.p3 GENE.NODE_5885_length_547_cov_215.451220~~NODE_5885_length_547_cov_215.451220.p3  ORF type:complete len:84 (-),score=25.61 NODE_5885_length_547_cov_215.451220:146-397(-)